jgi:hypothetical protein
LIVSACGLGPFGGCNAAGCVSLLVINLTGLDIQASETYDVKLCVGEVCVNETITIDVAHPGTGDIVQGDSRPNAGGPGGLLSLSAHDDRVDFYLPQGEYGTEAQVTFSLTDAEGNVLVKTEGTAVPLERSQPNGRWCPPICFWGELTL